ncbi:spore germination protein [Paenibacillus lutrae]|uniref:Spore germination protein n=1 Tax=Paenibacillus lutrae TaxID=2078573 RepID=A0A7X3JXK7_9BACL|nr:spore germination protein [Paenibacillus lutrae]MVO98102.1 spore germination protein [Paenibacillus lutrae]
MSQNNLQIWSEQQLKRLFEKYADLVIMTHYFGDENAAEVILVFSEGTCDSSIIGMSILPSLERLYKSEGGFFLHGLDLYASLPLTHFKGEIDLEKMTDHLFLGEIMIIFPEIHAVFLMDISKLPQRSPEESSTEISIKGPKDGFVENIVINTALIRKRLRGSSLCNENFVIGTRTKTRVGLMYVDDIISPVILNEVRQRLNHIKVDGIYSSNQIEELIADYKYSLVPLVDNTGRPDFIVDALLNGRFAIIVDGSPMITVGPASLFLQLKSAEDLHFNFIYTSFARIIRIISLFLTILLPALWVALTAYHQDQVPFRLLATIATARLGLPFSAQIELFVLLILLEIFREAGVRLPSSIGQTLTVVGGLIIGDAAIRAGLVSPSVVVVGAVTTVCAATLVNQNLGSTVSIIRFFLFFCSALLGMFGVIMGTVLLVFYLSRLRSFGIPYLSPFSPPFFKQMIPGILRLPWPLLTKRSPNLHPQDPDHQESDNRENS